MDVKLKTGLRPKNNFDTTSAVSNSIFVDPFGYMWMLNKIHKNLSFEERIEILEEEMK